MILYIKHIPFEGPEKIEIFFQKHGFASKTIDLSQGDKLPKNFKKIDAVVSLGGPMNVYEEKQYPFLKEEHLFIQKIIKQSIPFLGVCLGAQLLCKAAGGKVGRSPSPEIGFMKVQLTHEGRQDPLFIGLPDEFDVFQWHGDMCSVPPKGTWLSSSEICPFQAFKVGGRAYGLQFHLEIFDTNLKQWAPIYWADRGTDSEQDLNRMVDDYRKSVHNLENVLNLILENFYQTIINTRTSF